LSGLLKDGRARIVLEEAFAEAKSEARANGLTDADIDAELEAWRGERKPTRVDGKVTQKTKRKA